jgi:hypothetical protein
LSRTPSRSSLLWDKEALRKLWAAAVKVPARMGLTV